MSKIRKILHFSLPFIRPYWAVLLTGILSGVFFGLSNGGVIWMTQTMLNRLTPSVNVPVPALTSSNVVSTATAPVDHPPASSKKRIHVWKGFDDWMARAKVQVRNWTEELIDPWLPVRGRTMDWRQMVGVLVMLPLLAFARSGSAYLATYCMAWTGQRVINDLRVKVLDVLSGLSLDYFNRATMGDMITRINDDTAALKRCLSFGIEHIVADPVTLISVFSMLLLLDWQLTLSTFILAPAIVIPVAVLGRKARQASKRVIKTSVVQSSHIVEMLSNIRVVKAFNLEKVQVQRFRENSEKLFHQSMRRIVAMELVTPLIECIAIMGFAVLVVFVIKTERRIPDMMTFFMGLIMFYMPVKKLARLHVVIKQTGVGVDRLTSILGEKPTVVDPPNPKSVHRFERDIRLENVSFSYGHDLVLKNLNITIPRGYKLGVAGESGSGKSTLVNLLFRFFDPLQGRLTVDGVDLREISLENVRQLMALVSQDVVVFDQTVAENIACGRIGATRTDVVAAARAAHAHDFIMALPEGYDSRVGERGVTLSGGQRQRIAIARAFIRNAPILVLDEATAALDSKSESEVQKAIDQLAENRTVVCIAHRLATLINMDSIIVLSKGEIVEQGSFGELIKVGGIFAQMAMKQGMVAEEFANQMNQTPQ